MTARSARAGAPLGYLEAVAAGCLLGTSGIFGVYLFRAGVPPETVAVIRPAVGALALGVWMAAARPDALCAPPKSLLFLALGGGSTLALVHLAYQLSTDAVGVPATVALLYLAPAIVSVVSGPILGEWPSRRRMALVALTVLGVWLSVAGAERPPATFGAEGVVWGTLAASGYAAYAVFGRYAATAFGPERTVLYSTAGASVLLAGSVPLLSGPLVLPSSARAWALLLALGLLTVAVAQFLLFAALERVDAAKVTVGAATEPVVAALLASALLSQELRPLGWVGLALVVSGVVGMGFGEPPGPPSRSSER